MNNHRWKQISSSSSPRRVHHLLIRFQPAGSDLGRPSMHRELAIMAEHGLVSPTTPEEKNHVSGYLVTDVSQFTYMLDFQALFWMVCALWLCIQYEFLTERTTVGSEMSKRTTCRTKCQNYRGGTLPRRHVERAATAGGGTLPGRNLCARGNGDRKSVV